MIYKTNGFKWSLVKKLSAAVGMSAGTECFSFSVQMLVQCELCQNRLGARHISIKTKVLQPKGIKSNQTSLNVEKEKPRSLPFLENFSSLSPLN